MEPPKMPEPSDNLPVPQSTQPSRRVDPPVGTRWKPGQSGNPGGRSKGLQRRVRELVGEDGDKLATFLLSVLNSRKEKTSDRLEAAKILLERGWGKAPISIETDSPASFVLVSAFALQAQQDELEDAA